MGQLFDSVLDTIGRTPLVRTPRLSSGLHADVLFKLESFNPMSSVKDRIGRAMIEDALSSGLIREGTVVIEPTSRSSAPPRGSPWSSPCPRRCRSRGARS
jgi:cysteine synthase A